jgi:biotin carboxyl carrier protein
MGLGWAISWLTNERVCKRVRMVIGLVITSNIESIDIGGIKVIRRADYRPYVQPATTTALKSTANAPPLALRGSVDPNKPTVVNFGDYQVYYPPENLKDGAFGVGIPTQVPTFLARTPDSNVSRMAPISLILASVSGRFYPARVDRKTNLPIDPRKGRNPRNFRNMYFTDFIAKDDILGIIIPGKGQEAVEVRSMVDGFLVLFGCYADTEIVTGANLMLISPITDTLTVKSVEVGTYVNQTPKGGLAPTVGDIVEAGDSLGTIKVLGVKNAQELYAKCRCQVLRLYVKTGDPVEFNGPIMLLQKL